MAVIHISEAEAARDLTALLTKLDGENEIYIDRGQETIAVLQSPAKIKHASDAFALLFAGGSHELTSDKRSGNIDDLLKSLKHQPVAANLLSDAEIEFFAAAVEESIQLHKDERLFNPWEAS